MWVNFAKTGNPSTERFTLEKYDSKERKTIIIDEEVEMGDEYQSEQRKLLDSILKYYVNGNTSQMLYNVPQTYRIIAQVIAGLAILISIILIISKQLQ